MMISKGSIDKRVRKESVALIKEAKKGLRRFGSDLKPDDRQHIATLVEGLEHTLEGGDPDSMRVGLLELDEQVDFHLSSMRKSGTREYVDSMVIAIAIALLLRAFVVEAFKIPSGSMIPTLQVGDHIFVNKFVYGLRIPWTKTRFFEFREPRRGEVVVFINPCTPDKDFIKRIVATEGETVEVRCDKLFVNGEEVESEWIDDRECTYWDFDTETSTSDDDWTHETCSLFRERNGGEEYYVIYPADRPNVDQKRRDKPLAPYMQLRGSRDFPIGAHGIPDCRIDIDPRSPEEKARSRGTIEPSIPESQRYQNNSCAPVRRYVVPKGHVFAMGDNRNNSSDSRTWGSVPVENIKGKALFIWWSKKGEKAGGIEWGRIGKVVD